MVSVNSTAFLKSFGFVAVCHSFLFLCVLGAPYGAPNTHTKYCLYLVSSLSVSDRPVQRCAPDGHLLTVTNPDAVLIQFDLLRMSKILLETVHVEDYNKCIKICASILSLAKVILRCTVSET